MAQKNLSKNLYFLYNLLNKQKLSFYYNQVKKAQSTIDHARIVELEKYCSKWGFDSSFEKNPLMGKEDVKKWVEKVDSLKIESWAYTGGSYGEPLRMPYSKERNYLRTATFRYYNELGGYRLGDPYVLIRAKDKSSFLKYLRNEFIFIPQDISEKKMEEFIAELKQNRIKVLMGYPTVIYELALYLEHNPDKKNGLKIESIITVSEPLESFKRKIISDVFQCKFVDRYSNEEVGMIAQQRVFGGEYFVNRFGVYVEVVDQVTLLPVKEGRQGKVVVTDVYNDLIPVIRYDTGDLATVHKYENKQLVSIREIVGRVTEQITDVNENPVSPLMLGPFIYKPLARQGQVFQYQFAQVGSKDYELRVKAKSNNISSALESEIIKGLSTALGYGANVKFILKDDIKPQPSGKRPVFKNEMK